MEGSGGLRFELKAQSKSPERPLFESVAGVVIR
jgi:hypothetical protein